MPTRPDRITDVGTPRQADGWKRRGPGFLFRVCWLGTLCLLPTAGCSSFSARGLNSEGVRLFEQTRYQEAIQNFQKAIENNPNDADAYYNLAATYHRLGTVNRRSSDLSQAETYYNLCLNRDPSHRECHRGLAVLLVEQGRGEEAFRLLQAWFDRRPDSPDPKIELARLSEESGNREAAKRYLADALQVQADDPRALAALGRLREQAGDHLIALHNYQQSLQADRFQPEVAARVATLQSVANPQPAAVPTEPTRMAADPAGSRR